MAPNKNNKRLRENREKNDFARVDRDEVKADPSDLLIKCT